MSPCRAQLAWNWPKQFREVQYGTVTDLKCGRVWILRNFYNGLNRSTRRRPSVNLGLAKICGYLYPIGCPKAGNGLSPRPAHCSRAVVPLQCGMRSILGNSRVNLQRSRMVIYPCHSPMLHSEFSSRRELTQTILGGSMGMTDIKPAGIWILRTLSRLVRRREALYWAGVPPHGL